MGWRNWVAAFCCVCASLAVVVQPPTGGATGAAPPGAAAAGADGGQRRNAVPIGVPMLGMPFIHDPSTVVHFRGKYYVFGTGPGIMFYSSPDGQTWTREKPLFERPTRL